jgi:hypothetical protein
LVPLNPAIALLPSEDTTTNRELVAGRLKTYLQVTALPGKQYTAGMLRDAMIDGIVISDAAVTLNGSAAGSVATTILELPVLGNETWE